MCIGKPESMASSMCISSSLRGLMCIAVYLLVSIYCVKSSGVLSTVSSHLKSSKEILCTDVRYAYTAKGFSNSDVPFQAISVHIQPFGICEIIGHHRLLTSGTIGHIRPLQMDTIGSWGAIGCQALSTDCEIIGRNQESFLEFWSYNVATK
ncbi:hypothetical protein TNCT_335751 [Trichonephila clavata]|uniref:Uncharacterized protein n=1 Tax=Trichonephila clavata TaxID=2740835 RepID=A0A8X6HFR7_TRICU|nr:hypothetical protein TNCT_335751 [Trichonephila clavata]